MRMVSREGTEDLKEIKEEIGRLAEAVKNLQATLDRSGIGLLGQMNVRELVEQNLALLMSPEIMRLPALAHTILEAQESIDQAVELLASLERTGLLRIAQGMADISQDAVPYLIEPQNLRIFGNVATLLQLLTEIEPARASHLVRTVQEGLDETLSPETLRNLPRIGFGGLLAALNDPDVQRGLGIMVLLLKGLGRAGPRLAGSS